MKKVKIKNNGVPGEIRALFGKFYLFSFIYIIFFGIIYPFFLLKRVSIVSSILIFILLIIVYIYMIDDVRTKKKTFFSNMYFYLIIIVFFVISFSLVRFILTLEF